MKKNYLFLFILFVMLSCKSKTKQYPQELQQIFEAHGGLQPWGNVKTVSFSVNNEDFTVDLISGKKVVNAPNYSLGFDGKNYWISQKDSVFLRTPKSYLNAVSSMFLMPFSLASEKIFNEKIENSKIFYRNRELSFNSNNNITQEIIKGNSVIEFEEWQEISGFKLPKKVKKGLVKSNKTDKLFIKEIEFTNVAISQATFDDKFYQKPN